MEVLSKIFAVGLALSQITSAPDAIKTRFDPVSDQAVVVQLLKDGCAHFRRVFDVEDINLDDLIATAMQDPLALMPNAAIFQGLDLRMLATAYRQFCKADVSGDPPIDLGPAIEYYNQALEDLPDPSALSKIRRSGKGDVVDDQGNSMGELYLGGERRVWVGLNDVPSHVRQAFVSAEDKGFFTHRGIDEQGLVRAFLENLLNPGRARGGSTITQQVVKNLLVGNEVTFERKIREMVLASKVERSFTKNQILELYLNSIYLGRRAWGVEMAARSYFGKSVGSLSVAEGAVLAALAKGPSYFDPDRYVGRLRERFAYVIKRMKDDQVIPASRRVDLPAITTIDTASARTTPSYFLDQVAREAKSIPDTDAKLGSQYVVKSTLDPGLQRSVESALQDGLAKYERDFSRAEFDRPEANLGQAIQLVSARPVVVDRPAWQIALSELRLPLSDVHWTPAVVISKAGRRKAQMQVGLADGRILPLATNARKAVARISLYDVVYVRVGETRRGGAARAELQIRPQVQGAALVLDNKTGRIMAMSGGFSYRLSQLNRATQGRRQPGSAIKPLMYLSALKEGLRPSSLVSDQPISLPPLGRGETWSPKNYDYKSSGRITLRDAIAKSRNLATVNLLNGGIKKTPEASFDYVCALALRLKLYPDCERYYPFVLGAQPIRLVDLAAFYATIANEGVRPVPHVVAAMSSRGAPVYTDAVQADQSVSPAERAAFYQLKTMLQDVLARGTARSIAYLAPYAAGKTGTTSDENDSWFVGFTNEVTVAVWMGYDNADGSRRTLGSGATGGALAVPIFETVIKAVWDSGVDKTPLLGSSKALSASLSCADAAGDTDATGSAKCGRKASRRNRAAKQARTQNVAEARPAEARAKETRSVRARAKESRPAEPRSKDVRSADARLKEARSTDTRTREPRARRDTARSRQAAGYGCDQRSCSAPVKRREWRPSVRFGYRRPEPAFAPSFWSRPPAWQGFFFGSW